MPPRGPGTSRACWTHSSVRHRSAWLGLHGALGDCWGPASWHTSPDASRLWRPSGSRESQAGGRGHTQLGEGREASHPAPRGVTLGAKLPGGRRSRACPLEGAQGRRLAVCSPSRLGRRSPGGQGGGRCTPMGMSSAEWPVTQQSACRGGGPQLPGQRAPQPRPVGGRGERPARGREPRGWLCCRCRPPAPHPGQDGVDAAAGRCGLSV